MAHSATVACTETMSHSRGPGNIRVRVSFSTEAVWSAILATAGLLTEITTTLKLIIEFWAHGWNWQILNCHMHCSRMQVII